MYLAYSTVSCGNIISGMSSQLPSLIHLIIEGIKFGVLVILVIVGMIDLGKAVMAQKDDEIKKAEQTLIKRIIAGALVFFVVMIVQTVFGLIAGDEENSGIWDCFDCFVNGPTEKAKNNPNYNGACRAK